MTNLDIAKALIWKYIPSADCGIFDSRNIVEDTMETLYDKDGLTIDICYDELYIEVFGLTDEEFNALKEYYDTCCEIYFTVNKLKALVETFEKQTYFGKEN